MSIKPPSDIVLDVARAADPARSMEATERLARMGTDSNFASAGFSKVLGDLPSSLDNTASLRTQMEVNSAHAHETTEKLDPQTKAYRGFEAMMLQNMVETMLPDSEEFFGQGSAGMIWKSMLAQELGKDLAKKVDLGFGAKFSEKMRGAALHKHDAAALLTHAVAIPPHRRS